MNNFIVSVIKIMSLLTFIIGVLMIIACFSKEDAGFFVDGIGLIIASVFLAGFSNIVDAACRYIDKCDAEDEKNSADDEEAEE